MTTATDARSRLSEVLDPRSNALALEEASWEHGYLDLLGEEPPESTGVTQNLMLTRAVPVIYERWWRPDARVGGKGAHRPGHGRGSPDRALVPRPRPG